MDTREQKGLEIAARFRIARDGSAWVVPSQSSGAKYHVDPVAPECSCEDFGLRGPLPCKHIYAVRYVIEREAGGAVPELPPVPENDAEMPAPARKTYRQAWGAYNLAQCREKEVFQRLLRDLCAGLENPPQQGRGRPRVPLSDAVFCACLKVYLTLSCRRSSTDYRDAAEKGFIDSAPHYNSVLKCLEDPALTPVLRSLIAESSRPLSVVEEDFAADSSAFTTNRFTRWYDAKYGRERAEHVWVKVQVMCGVRTNIITSAIVCDQDGPDSPYLPQLVQETAANFAMNEVSADKGYSSVNGHDAVAAVGATPLIAFKRTASGGSGGVWGRMFHYFQFQREDFLRRYHKRSNVESVFSAVKRKFGDALRSKSRPAQVNEMLLKLLAHNLCVLVQEIHELGIEPVFWPDTRVTENAEPVTIIRFPGA